MALEGIKLIDITNARRIKNEEKAALFRADPDCQYFDDDQSETSSVCNFPPCDEGGRSGLQSASSGGLRTTSSNGPPRTTSSNGPPWTTSSNGPPRTTSSKGPPRTTSSKVPPRTASSKGPPRTTSSGRSTKSPQAPPQQLFVPKKAPRSGLNLQELWAEGRPGALPLQRAPGDPAAGYVLFKNYQKLDYHGLTELIPSSKFESLSFKEIDDHFIRVRLKTEEGARKLYKHLKIDPRYEVTVLLDVEKYYEQRKQEAHLIKVAKLRGFNTTSTSEKNKETMDDRAQRIKQINEMKFVKKSSSDSSRENTGYFSDHSGCSQKIGTWRGHIVRMPSVLPPIVKSELPRDSSILYNSLRESDVKDTCDNHQESSRFSQDNTNSFIEHENEMNLTEVQHSSSPPSNVLNTSDKTEISETINSLNSTISTPRKCSYQPSYSESSYSDNELNLDRPDSQRLRRPIAIPDVVSPNSCDKSPQNLVPSNLAISPKHLSPEQSLYQDEIRNNKFDEQQPDHEIVASPRVESYSEEFSINDESNFDSGNYQPTNCIAISERFSAEPFYFPSFSICSPSGSTDLLNLQNNKVDVSRKHYSERGSGIEVKDSVTSSYSNDTPHFRSNEATFDSLNSSSVRIKDLKDFPRSSHLPTSGDTTFSNDKRVLGCSHLEVVSDPEVSIVDTWECDIVTRPLTPLSRSTTRTMESYQAHPERSFEDSNNYSVRDYQLEDDLSVSGQSLRPYHQKEAMIYEEYHPALNDHELETYDNENQLYHDENESIDKICERSESPAFDTYHPNQRLMPTEEAFKPNISDSHVVDQPSNSAPQRGPQRSQASRRLASSKNILYSSSSDAAITPQNPSHSTKPSKPRRTPHNQKFSAMFHEISSPDYTSTSSSSEVCLTARTEHISFADETNQTLGLICIFDLIGDLVRRKVLTLETTFRFVDPEDQFKHSQ